MGIRARWEPLSWDSCKGEHPLVVAACEPVGVGSRSAAAAVEAVVTVIVVAVTVVVAAAVVTAAVFAAVPCLSGKQAFCSQRPCWAVVGQHWPGPVDGFCLGGHSADRKGGAPGQGCAWTPWSWR